MTKTERQIRDSKRHQPMDPAKAEAMAQEVQDAYRKREALKAKKAMNNDK